MAKVGPNFNRIQADIVRRLDDESSPKTCWKTFCVKRPMGDRGLTPFLTFPGPKAVVDLEYTRQSANDRRRMAQRDWVVEHVHGHRVIRVSVSDYERDPEACLSAVVAQLKQLSEERLAAEPEAWADDIAAYRGHWDHPLSDADEESILRHPEMARLHRAFLSVLDDPRA